MTFLPARPAKSRATPRQTDCLIYMGWAPARIAQMSFREASRNILTFSKKACKLTHMASYEIGSGGEVPKLSPEEALAKQELIMKHARGERWSDDSVAPQHNDMSASVMAPDELFGDRFIAAGLFIDCALKTLVDCPLYPKEDCKLDTIVALLRNCKISLNDQLKRYPAASIQTGTKLS